jgi:alcohol dehydrogenase
MQGFDQQVTTRAVFGENALDRVGALAREYGGCRVLVVSDPGIVAAGYPDRAMASISGVGLTAILFDGVRENPTTEHVTQGVTFAREHDIDFLVGLGGGSSMDCAKGINFVLTNGGTMSDYWGVGKATSAMLPMLAIPTTAGTGSEAQSFALIADAQTHQKMACGDPKAMCKAAILDPALTVSQPAYVTAVTGIDAISHAIETFVTTKRNPASQAWSRKAWKLLNANIERAVAEPGNLAARSGMQLGAHYAGAAIELSMLGASHAAANPLTAHFDVTHGVAVGVMLPHVIQFNTPVMEESYAELDSIGELGDGEVAAGDLLADRIWGLLEKTNLPTRLRDCDVTQDALPGLAEEAAEQWTAQFNPRPVSAAELLVLYERAW